MVQGEISEADTLTTRMGTIPSELTSDPPPSSPIFTLDALPAATLRPPNLSWLETGTEYAGLHTQYNSDSSTSAYRMVQKVTATQEVFKRPSICTTEKKLKTFWKFLLQKRWIATSKIQIFQSNLMWNFSTKLNHRKAVVWHRKKHRNTINRSTPSVSKVGTSA